MKKAPEHNPGRKLVIHSNKNLPFFFRVFFLFFFLLFCLFIVYSERIESHYSVQVRLSSKQGMGNRGIGESGNRGK